MTYSELEAKTFGASLKDQEAFKARAYYEDDLDVIFKKVDKDNRPCIPSGLCQSIIDRSVSYLFPEGTTAKIQDEALDKLLQSILQKTKALEKLDMIGVEGHVTGTVGLKSIWLSDEKQWTFDIQCIESLIIDHDPLNAEKISAIRIRFRFIRQENGLDKEYWYQEQWTETDYTEWNPIPVVPGQVPEFKPEDINQEKSGPHGYGEIPITLICHQLQLDTPLGKGEIDKRMRKFSRALAISLSKTGVADQLIQTPAYVRKNSANKDKITVKPAGVIDVDTNGEGDPDFGPLEQHEVPESSFKYQDKLKAMAFEAAQVTNPDIEKEMKAGGTISSVAWKAFNLPFMKKIKKLRVRYGEAGVEAHFEKILRMGKALNLPEYGSVNLEDDASYNVELVYPPFFEPTTAEKQEEVTLYQTANLPAEEEAKRVAGVFDITDEALIQAIQDEIEEKKELEKPTPLNMGA